jgi:Cof subfamily protein (haloacid dehalogenase superfamily)
VWFGEPLDPATIAAALRAAEEAGLIVVFVTGRPPRWMKPVSEATGHTGLAICANGALLYDLDSDRVVDQTPLAAAAAGRLVRAIRTAAPGALFAVELAAGFRHEQGWGAAESAADGEVVAAGEALAAGPVAKLLVRHPDLPFEELARRAQRVAGDDAVATWSGTRLVEISAAGVTKGFALQRLCHHLGVDAAEVIAFGDMPNDLAMLAWAGHSVAVANAEADVRRAADEVTAANVDDGVALVLERILAERAPAATPDASRPSRG